MGTNRASEYDDPSMSQFEPKPNCVDYLTLQNWRTNGSQLLYMHLCLLQGSPGIADFRHEQGTYMKERGRRGAMVPFCRKNLLHVLFQMGCSLFNDEQSCLHEHAEFLTVDECRTQLAAYMRKLETMLCPA